MYPERPRLKERRQDAKHRFVVLCDVLGFQKLATTQNAAELATRYDLLVREARRHFVTWEKSEGSKTENRKIGPRVAIFSDTLLLWSEAIDELTGPVGVFAYQAFFSQIAIFFCTALRMGFPLRVGIAFGECVIVPSRSLFVGPAIVNAYLAEQAQDWVGVGCHPSCFEGDLEILAARLRSMDRSPLRDVARRAACVEYPIPVNPDSGAALNLKFTIDWPFWATGSSITAGLRGGFHRLLSDQVEALRTTPFCRKWRSALDYYVARRRQWDSIFGGPFAIAEENAQLPT